MDIPRGGSAHRGLFLLLAAGCSGNKSAPPCTAHFSADVGSQAATITVDPASVVTTFVPKVMFGINAGAWLSRRDLQATQQKVQAAGNYLIRYPGGSRSDDFHWNGTGTYDENHYWVPSATTFTPGFTANELYRGTTSAGYGSPSKVTDGDPATRWLSNVNTDFPDAQWVYVDLGAARSFDSVQIVWGTPHATSFSVETWSSAAAWPPPYHAASGTWQATSAGTVAGTGETQLVSFTPVTAQFVRISMTASAAGAAGAYSIAELSVSSGATQLTSNTPSVSQSPATASSTDPASDGQMRDPFDFESFMTYVQSFTPTADAMITVNVGTGTPQEAAAWVHYANVVKGYQIRYWQIGNEMEANWETGGPLNAADYVRRYVQFYDAMKAEDPSIVVLGPVSGGIDEPSNLGDGKTFLRAFIELLGASNRADRIDAIDFHWYPNWEAVSDATGLATVSQLGTLATNLEAWLGAAGAGPEVPVFLTEYNMGIGAAHPPVYNNQLVNGLFTATALGEYIRHFGNGGGTALWTMFSGGPTPDWTTATAGDLGYLQTTNNAHIYQEHANYWAMQMMSTLWATAGDTNPHKLVATTSSHSSLATYANLRPDGALTLSVVNRDRANAYSGAIDLGSFKPGTAADVWTFDATNYVWQTTTKPYHAEPNTGPTHALTCGAAASTPFTVAPFSITVMRFAPPGAPTAVVPDAGTPDAGDGGTTNGTAVLVDDMESTTSGPILLNVGAGASPGSWFNAISTGSATNTITPQPFAFTAVTPPHETMSGVSSAHAAHVACTIADLYGYCQVGFNIVDPDGPFDLSKYTTVGFWARSSTGSPLKLQIANDDTVPAGGKCGLTTAAADGCWDSFASYVALTEAWQKFEIQLSALRQDGWGLQVPSFDATTARGVTFVVSGPASATAPPVTADVWVDDVYFR